MNGQKDQINHSPKCFAELRELCRKKWGYASPYRMGILAAETGYKGSHQYLGKPRAPKLYREGFEFGSKRLAEKGK